MFVYVMSCLAMLGLLVLIRAVWDFLDAPPPEPPPEPVVDLAAPYWEGLHAAARLQQTAMEFEQQICAEAVRRAKANSASLQTDSP